MTEPILGITDHLGVPIILLEFQGISERVVRETIVDTAFTGFCLLPAALYYALTGEEPRESREKVMSALGERRDVYEGNVNIRWFGEELTVEVFCISPEAAEEPQARPLVGTRLLTSCTFFIDFVSGYCVLAKVEPPTVRTG